MNHDHVSRDYDGEEDCRRDAGGVAGRSAVPALPHAAEPVSGCRQNTTLPPVDACQWPRRWKTRLLRRDEPDGFRRAFLGEACRGGVGASVSGDSVVPGASRDRASIRSRHARIAADRSTLSSRPSLRARPASRLTPFPTPCPRSRFGQDMSLPPLFKIVAPMSGRDEG